MSIFEYIIIAIASIVLIIVALFFLIKGLVNLLFLFLRLLPTIIKSAIYWALLTILYFSLRISNIVPELPFLFYFSFYFLIMGLILIRKYIKHGSIFDTYYVDDKSYVLNKKSKVIHEKHSASEETISPHHRKELSHSEAMDLINNNDKYHFKKS